MSHITPNFNDETFTGLLVGYSSEELEIMYCEAKTMQMFYALLEDVPKMQEWADKATACSVTLWALSQGHLI